ncbi:MAG: helix-turn-helix transcriptional regulator [Ignavibacteriales bacterium]|nr:helix-turn-helix transcriptional regulator [Ignavibacteriales bacterium]
MKKNANKQKGGRSFLKKVLQADGRKLTWLSESTGINYQRLQRIMNQGYEPTISEAAKIANVLKQPLQELFPSLDLSDALMHSWPNRGRSTSSLKTGKRRWGSSHQSLIL